MGRKLGTNVVMKEPQLLYNGYLKSTQMEKVGLFSQGPLAPHFGTAETLQQRNACFSSAEKYLS